MRLNIIAKGSNPIFREMEYHVEVNGVDAFFVVRQELLGGTVVESDYKIRWFQRRTLVDLELRNAENEIIEHCKNLLL